MADVHMEDVHRAGGVMAILGELDRAGLIDTGRAAPCTAPTLGDALARWDIARTESETRARVLPRRARRRADPDRLQPGRAAGTSSTSTAQTGVIRDVEHAFSQDGGLAVLYGNLAAGRLHREDRRRGRQRS